MLSYKILIVEDESIVAMDLKQRLAAMDYEVTATVSNGAAAIDQVSACLPDLILMDIQIKGDIDGIETAEIIQKKFEVPIVFLTANSDIATVTRAKKTGPLAYLLKPFENKSLQTTIEIALYRFQLEQKLKASESWLQAVLRSIGDAVIAADITGNVAFINSAVERITGWNSSEIENNDADEIINLFDGKTEQALDNPIKQCLREGASIELNKNTILENRSGEKIPVESNVTLIHNDQNTVIGCVMSFRDVTLAREAEQKITDYQDQLKKILAIRTDELNETTANLSHETNKRSKAEEEVIDLTKFPDESPDPILRILKNGTLVYANDASKKLLKYWDCKITELVSKNWINIVQEALLSERASEVEVNVNNIIYSLVVSPIIESGYVNLYGKDITLQKYSEKKERELQIQLERAKRMESLGLLAGGVAHDLNNMLSPIVAYPELILEELPVDSSIRQPIEQIGKSAQDAACVIQDLLTLARRGRYDMKPLDLNEVITEYLDSPSFETILKNNPNIKIKKHFETKLRLIKGSSPHLSKVIMNLIVNAIDSMDGKGTLSIETQCSEIDIDKIGQNTIEPGVYIVLKIQDTGCGIKSKDIEKIFEPYYSKKELQTKSGSGLGLSVVYGILKDHSGYYDIKSEIGKGTEFLLYFPVTNEVPQEPVKYIGNIKGNEKILIVDDNEILRSLLDNILSSLGYEVALVKNGTEAVGFMKNHTMDIIILDMIMENGFDGLDTYQGILKYHPQQKAIIVSGFSATDRVEEALELGVGAYVKKPFHFKSLAKVVREELDKTAKAAAQVY